MRHNRIKFWLGLAGAGALALSLGGCIFFPTDDGRKEATDEEKAKSNLELGVRYMELDQLELALDKLNYAVELDSNNSHIHDVLAVLYERIGKDQEAEQHFEKAIALKPDDASAISNYGRFLCDKGQYGPAMAKLQEAIALPLNTRKWFALGNAGNCELKQGDIRRAEEYLRTALQQNESYAPALLGMVKISNKKGEHFKARAFLERYTAVSPHTSETLWYAMQTERQLGNQQLAEELRQQLLQKFPLSNEAKQVKNIVN